MNAPMSDDALLASWSEAACYSKTLEFEDPNGSIYPVLREWLLDWPGSHELRHRRTMDEAYTVVEVEHFPVQLHSDLWGTTWIQADPEGRILKKLARAWVAEGMLEIED